MIVINTTSIQYYLYDDGSKRIQSQQEIVKWLDAIIDGKIEVRSFNYCLFCQLCV